LFGRDGDDGEESTFSTTCRFTGKYTECDEEEVIPLGAEIFGRCQHPIVAGSGTGMFEGVTGRLDYKDYPACRLLLAKLTSRKPVAVKTGMKPMKR